MGAESERRDSPLRRARTGGNGDTDRPTDDQQHPTTPNKRPSRLTPGAAVALQAKAGNRAVSRLVAQRRAATAPAARAPAKSQPTAAPSTAAPSSAGPSAAGPSPAGPSTAAAPVLDGRAAGVAVQRLVEGPGRGVSQDPKFGALKRDVKSKQQTLGKHPPAKAEADAAGRAAKPPQDDKEAQGKTANAEKMNAAKPGEFDKAAFVAAVNAAIAKQAPKNLEEADEFGSSGKAEAVKGEVSGKVEGGKKASAGQIESTTKAPPDTGAATVKPVTPLKPDQPPGTPGTPDPGKAIPDKAPPAATDFSAGPKSVNDEMAGAQVTEDQLAKSNEPEFTGALKEKKAGEQHAATAPGEVRGKEAETLAGAKAQAQQAGATAMAGMAASRGKSGKELDAGKGGAQSAEEQKRAQVTATLQKVFDATKKDVEDILSGLDKKVDEKFTKDEKTARDAFTADHKRRMDAYKDKRYSGWTGGLKWAKDKLLGMPEEANQIFVTARQGYVTAMQGVISGVADLIGTELNAAKARIAKGRTDLQAEVQKLPKDLQQLGKESAAEFGGKFDELTESVDAKGSELVDTLASKYTEALKAVDEEIEAEKEKNKGLVAKAIDAVKGVIQTIMQLKDLLLGVLAKAAQAVMAIIKDPIGFLGNLISAVGAGLQGFIANIGAHLQKGLVSWLLGTAAKAGLQLPEKFDLKGILGLIASLLGLTWASIRGRIVAKGVPEQAMSTVESGVPLVQKLIAGGVGGLWEDLKDQIGDLKETLLGKITEYLVPTVLIAGITWIVSLLNPASAFIKACKAIIDIVTFIITRGAQILEFVNAILDAVIAIAGGGAGGVPGLIEAALAKSIPVLIGFLAALLGIGGIADKVKKIFQTLSKPVMKAVDAIVGKIVAYGKKLWAKLKGRRKGKDGEPSPKDKAKIAKQAANEGYQAASSVPVSQVSDALGQVYAKWQPKGVKSIEMVPLGDHYFTVEASVNPTAKASKKGAVDAEVPPEKLSVDQVTATSFASSTTASSGVFSADSAPELTEIMTSGASQKKLRLSDSQEGSHAEEQVVNVFDRSWRQSNAEIASALPANERRVKRPWFDQVRMMINVSKSSCINCASYIVRFTKGLREKASSVNVGLKFAALYHGAQDVAKSNMDDFGDLIRLFVDKGKLRGTNRLGRLWGPSSIFGGKRERVTETSGKDAGKAGIAILRSAGVTVEVLEQDDAKGKASAEQKERLKLRNEKLKAAIAEVEEKLKVKKG